MKTRNKKLDNKKQLNWLGSYFYVTRIYTDNKVPELWIFRDSAGIGARINLSHDEMLNLDSSFVVTDEIIKAATAIIKNKLMYGNETLEVKDNEFFIC